MTKVADCAALLASGTNGGLRCCDVPEVDSLHREMRVAGAGLFLRLEVYRKTRRIPSDGGAVPFFAHLDHYFPLRHEVRTDYAMAVTYNCRLKTMNGGAPVWVPSIPQLSLEQESVCQLSQERCSQMDCSLLMAEKTSQNPSDGCVVLLSAHKSHGHWVRAFYSVPAVHNFHLGPMVGGKDFVDEVIPDNLAALQESADYFQALRRSKLGLCL